VKNQGAPNANSEMWQVRFTATAERQQNRLPKKIVAKLLYLTGELTVEGPIQPE
jgi:mRNA-degrading endonuclease RelE of RelBE toxin-antitoxin system